MNHPWLYIFLLLFGLGLTTTGVAEMTTAAQMQQLLPNWPPEGWMATPPDATSPFPPYIAPGEFNATIYRTGRNGELWSAHVSVTDQQTAAQARQLLNNLAFCEKTEYKSFPARSCLTQGESIGRHGLAYAAQRYLVEISVIGPLPLELPELNLQLPH